MMSQASASSSPPVIAKPLTAAITGASMSSITEMKVTPPVSRNWVEFNSFRSSPAQNARPLPVMITHPISRSARNCCMVRQNCERNSALSALSFSGRLSVTIARPLCFSSRITGSLMTTLREAVVTHAAARGKMRSIAGGELDRGQWSVGVRPHFGEVFLDRTGLLDATLGAQRLCESVQRSRVVRISLKIRAENCVGALVVPNLQHLAAERLTRGVVPRRRLVVAERVLLLDRIGKVAERLPMVSAGMRDRFREQRRG